MQLKEKRVIVTGATSGIGEATAKLLLEEGHQVLATGRNEAKLSQLTSDFSGCTPLAWDLSDLESLKEYAKKVKGCFGEIDGFVHCAGIDATASLSMTKPGKLQEIFSINTFAAMLLIGQFAKKGWSKAGSSFVLISSLSAHEGAFAKSMYAASKGALEAFVKTSASELAEKQMRINALAPGIVKTQMVENTWERMTDKQKATLEKDYHFGLGEPEDIANAISFLLGEKSRWITGQTIIIDGGHLYRKC